MRTPCEAAAARIAPKACAVRTSTSLPSTDTTQMLVRLPRLYPAAARQPVVASTATLVPSAPAVVMPVSSKAGAREATSPSVSAVGAKKSFSGSVVPSVRTPTACSASVISVSGTKPAMGTVGVASSVLVAHATITRLRPNSQRGDRSVEVGVRIAVSRRGSRR